VPVTARELMMKSVIIGSATDKAGITAIDWRYVCFTPESGHLGTAPRGQLSAKRQYRAASDKIRR